MSSPTTAPTPSSHPTQGATPSSPNPFGANPSDYFMVVFYVLLTSMTIRQETVLTQSKELSANASMQNQLNKENASIKFSIPRSGGNSKENNQVMAKNEEYAAERENIQNALITARQVGQVTMTEASTNVNILQQNASEDSGWLQTLNTVFQVIDQISPASAT